MWGKVGNSQSYAAGLFSGGEAIGKDSDIYVSCSVLYCCPVLVRLFQDYFRIRVMSLSDKEYFSIYTIPTNPTFAR